MIYYFYLLGRQLTPFAKTGNYRHRYHKYLKTKAWRFNRGLMIFYRLFGIKYLFTGPYCEDCGGRNVIQLHHERYNWIFLEFLPFARGDFRVLCKSCHMRVEARKRG